MEEEGEDSASFESTGYPLNWLLVLIFFLANFIIIFSLFLNFY